MSEMPTGPPAVTLVSAQGQAALNIEMSSVLLFAIKSLNHTHQPFHLLNLQISETKNSCREKLPPNESKPPKTNTTDL